MSKRLKSRGASLLELMVSVAIIAILLFSLSPTLKKLPSPKSPKREAHKLKGLIEFLHLSARLREEEVSLFLSGQSFKAISESRMFSKGKLSSSVTPNESGITFYPSGVVSPRTVNLSGSSENCSLTLSLRGRVKVLCR